MTIDVACPGCGKSYTQPESLRGKRARCKRCGVEFRIGELTAAPEPAPPAAPRPKPRPAPRPEPELIVPEPPKLSYLDPAISLPKLPPAPVMAPPPPPTLRAPTEVVVPRRSAPAAPVLPDSIPAECPHCGYRYGVAATLAGRRARCKSCGEVFRLPTAAAVVPTPAAPVARAVPTRAAPPRAAYPDDEIIDLPSARAPGWSLPENGIGPVIVGAVAVGGCLAVVVLGVLIRALFFHRGGAAAPGPEPTVAKAEAAHSFDFDPFPDEPPSAPIREDLLQKHRAAFRQFADAGEALITIFRSIDGPPDAATLAKKRAAEAQVVAADTARAVLPRPNPAEEYRLLVEFSARLIDLGVRQKAEIRRLLARVPAGDFAEELRRQDGRIDGAVGRLRAAMAAGPSPVPCIDVLFPDLADADGLAGEAVRGRLELMTDTAPPEVFRYRSVDGRPGTGVRLGPVADPQAFARMIRFGRVASVRGRKITVVDVRPDEADLAEARSGRSGP